jgi:hypothetical protein
MRPDMAKVIVERPRVGSRLKSRKKGYQKYLQQADFTHLPRVEPMLGRWRGMQKWFNEHLGPMRRYLRSQGGRPWNSIYKDLREHVRFDNVVQKHVLTHVFDYVHLEVRIENDRVVNESEWRRNIVLGPGEMYVCPRSGILKVVRPRREFRPKRRVQFVPLVQFHFRDNTWWEVRLRERPNQPGELWDFWLEKSVAKVSVVEQKSIYGGNFVAVSKRALSRVEVRNLNRRIRERRRR